MYAQLKTLPKLFFCLLLVASLGISRETKQKKIQIHKTVGPLTFNEIDNMEEFFLIKSSALQQKRQELIKKISTLIPQEKVAKKRDGLKLRLAAIYLEEYQGSMGIAYREYDEQVKKQKANHKPLPETKPDLSQALGALENAHQLYEYFYKTFPTHAKRDEILYYYAYILLEKRKVEQSMALFQELYQKHPDSRFATKAMVQVADYDFTQYHFKEALAGYERILLKKKDNVFTYALYKKAWCFYNLQQPSLMIDLLKEVIRMETGSAHGNLSVQTEAIRDLALPLVDLGRQDEGIEFYAPFEKKIYQQGMETLAALSLDRGDYANSKKIYQLLIDKDATELKNIQYEARIIEGLRLQEHKKEMIARIYAIFPLYGPESRWFEYNSDHAVERREGIGKLEEISRKYALEFHAEAQKTNNDQLYQMASEVYLQHLKYFGDYAEANALRFNLAEIFFRQKRYPQAAENYLLVYRDEAQKDSLRRDSLFSALLSLSSVILQEKNLASQETKKKKQAKEEVKKVEITKTESQFAGLGEEFIAKYPEDKENPGLLFELSQIYFRDAQFDKAMEKSWQLVNKHPTYSNTKKSAYLIIEILNNQKEYEKLTTACRKFLFEKAFNQPEFREDIARILRETEIKRISLYEESGKFKRAAELYLKFVIRHAKEVSPLHEVALFNASVNFEKAGMKKEALETEERFVREFPGSAKLKEAYLALAKSYEAFARLGEAAKIYEKFSHYYPTQEEGKHALRLASLYYWGNGNFSEAEKLMLRNIEQHPKSKKELEEDLSIFYLSQKNGTALSAYYLKQKRKEETLEAQFSYLVKATEAVRGFDPKAFETLRGQAERLARKNKESLQKSSLGATFLAKVAFWKASELQSQFDSLSLGRSVAQVEKRFLDKFNLLKEMEAAYAETAAFDGKELGLESLFKTAEAYHTLIEQVLEAPEPKGLSAKALDEYRSGVRASLVTPLKTKALALATQCLNYSKTYNLHSRKTAGCYQIAAQEDPSHFVVVRTAYLPSLILEVAAPEKSAFPIALSEITTKNYPIQSSSLFNVKKSRLPEVEEDTASAIPLEVSLQSLGAKRLAEVEEVVAKGADKPNSLNALNLARIQSPQKAIAQIHQAIETSPDNMHLMNLLAVAYLESGNFAAARVIWLSMGARGVDEAFIWNNLGVLSMMENQEETARGYFLEATKEKFSKFPLLNLGFLALAYRNGEEAKQYFEKAAGLDNDDVTAKIGSGIADIQLEKFDAARSQLTECAKVYRIEPYSKLSLGLLLKDHFKDPLITNQILDLASQQRDITNEKYDFNSLLNAMVR